MIAGIHRDNGAGNAAGHIAAQEEGSLGYFVGADVALQGRFFGVDLLHIQKAMDSPRRQGIQRPGGDGVDPDVIFPKLGGQLPDAMLQGRLGGAHHVVAGVHLLRSLKGHRDDAPPSGHQRGRVLDQGQQGISAHVQGNSESFPVGVGKPAGQVLPVGVSDAMHQKRYITKRLRDLLKCCLNLRVVRGIAGQGNGVIQRAGQPDYPVF